VRRGFKAQAERLALEARESLGLKKLAPIDPWAVAKSLGVEVLEFDSLTLAKPHRRQLLTVDPESWSGLTLRNEDGYFVVLNPSHPRTRQCSTLMHELAHIQLKHVPSRVDISVSGLMLLSDYPDDQEREADWLAGAILLPRDALHCYRRKGWDTAAICEEFGISAQLCEWRIRMTGVDLQLRRRWG
jgi:Zn-dependent peptidase ImmA (M78 family)